MTLLFVQSVSSTVDKYAVADSLLTAPGVSNDESSLSPPQSPADRVNNTTVMKSNGNVVPPSHCPEIKRFCFFSLN